MNHTIPAPPSASFAVARRSGRGYRSLSVLGLALVAMTFTGCFRATGIQRDPLVGEEIPERGGDRVAGLKSTAGSGDYYLGNDFVQIAIDGTRFGDPVENAIAGALSGGSIVDAGYLALDTSFHRVSVPGDALDRLTPVVNQDARVELVFDQFLPGNTGDLSRIEMRGYLLDPDHKIAGAGWDASGRVANVTVNHTLTLGKLDRYFTLTTRVENHGATTLGIRNISDLLAQQGGGYRFAVPATADALGNPLAESWGIEIPGSDFTQPLAEGVRAPLVGLMNCELGAATLDSHASLGFLPLDADQFLVTSKPQHPLTDLRPIFPDRLAIGSLPVAGLAAGASLSHARRLYIYGGVSTATNAEGTPTLPSAVNTLFNVMDAEKYSNLRVQDRGLLSFNLVGSAVRQGPLPTEIRIEKQVPDGAGGSRWELARVEWMEPNESIVSQTSLAGSTMDVVLPVGTYRTSIRNKYYKNEQETFVNSLDPDSPQLRRPLTIKKDLRFAASAVTPLCPEAALVTNPQGLLVRNLYSVHFFATKERDAPAGALQPLRITLVGQPEAGKPRRDAEMRRQRTVGTQFDPLTKAPAVTSLMAPGQYQFRGGNEMFGTGFTNYNSTEFAWLPNGDPSVFGDRSAFKAYGTRGPLSLLESQDVVAFDGQTDTAHLFVIWPQALPTGWTSFDMPGPSQATSGGFNPAEKLASAMAEGVQVVAHTEQDLQVDAPGLYRDFRMEFGHPYLTDAMRTAIGQDPFVVGARTSTLNGFGTVSALFTPVANSNRNGGAKSSAAWTLADFLKQAQGEFQVIHRPRGPEGLFTRKGFDPAVALGQGVNAWWNGGGLYAFGRTNGSFEALELLRGEGFSRLDPNTWFGEFKAVRQDWFAILKQQTPDKFTKALGLSSARFSLDTPVGLARTYLKTTPTTESDLTGVLAALKAGAAVASTGPFLDVSIGTTGPGGVVAASNGSVTLNVALTKTPWMPVDEIRVVVNGVVVQTLANPIATFTQSTTDPRVWTGTFTVALAPGKDAFVIVEAGVPLETRGDYALNTPWSEIMRGIYPIAVTNPIFVDVTGGGYTPPNL